MAGTRVYIMASLQSCVVTRSNFWCSTLINSLSHYNHGSLYCLQILKLLADWSFDSIYSIQCLLKFQVVLLPQECSSAYILKVSSVRYLTGVCRCLTLG